MGKILCIDDEIIMLKAVSIVLREFGHDVAVATNGEDGLKKLPEFKPELIICDVSMPGMDGFEFLKAIRGKHPELADIPFIYMSARIDHRDIIESLDLGADDFIKKPPDMELLAAKVNAHLRQVSRMKIKKEKEQIKLYKSLSGDIAEHDQKISESYDLLLERLECEHDELCRLKDKVVELKRSLGTAERKNSEAIKNLTQMELSLNISLDRLRTIRGQVLTAKNTVSEDGVDIGNMNEQLDNIAKAAEVTIYPVTRQGTWFSQ